MANRNYMKHLNVGIGGINCACCFPAPGKRDKIFRKIRRKLKAETTQEVNNYKKGD